MRYLLLTVAACFAMCAVAQEKQTKFYKLYGPGVFINVDRPAMFLHGGTTEGFQRYVGNNFVYSKELWKRLHSPRFRVDCTITRTGKVTDVSVKIPVGNASLLDAPMVDAPQEVTDQIVSLCEDMPSWVPAVVRKQEVSSRFSTVVHVVDMLASERFSNSHTMLPFSFSSWLRKMRSVAADKTYKDGMPRLAAGKKIERLAEIADVAPEYARTSSAYSRLLAAIGRGSDAYRHLTVATARYADNNWWPRDDVQSAYSYLHSGGYEGKTEVWLHLLMSAIACDAALPADSVEHIVGRTRSLVCEKIANHDIVNFDWTDMESGDDTRYRRLMQEKFGLAINSRGSLAPDEIAALEHEQVSEYSMGMIDKYVEQGKINNARIVQITHELEELRHKKQDIPNLAANTVRMYAVNALLEYLYGGTAAQDRYLRSAIEGDGKPYAKELEALRSAIASAALTDADRKAVARCIAAFAPIKGVDDAKAFYALRKRVWAAYPIAWLGKCDI